MDGLYFYWIIWIFWIICTFFMKKTKQRLSISVVLLLSIILSRSYLKVDELRINASAIFLLIYGFRSISIRSRKQMLYLLICILTISMAFSSFQLFELYDPVWLLFDRDWMFACILLYVTLMLLKDMKSRIICLLIGAIQGDLVYGFILGKLHFQYDVGSFHFLDVAALSVFLVAVWSMLEDIVRHIDVLLQKKPKEKLG